MSYMSEKASNKTFNQLEVVSHAPSDLSHPNSISQQQHPNPFIASMAQRRKITSNGEAGS